jgi:hypothetical protein
MTGRAGDDDPPGLARTLRAARASPRADRLALGLDWEYPWPAAKLPRRFRERRRPVLRLVTPTSGEVAMDRGSTGSFRPVS